MDKLVIIRDRAKALNIKGSIFYADRSNKKFMILRPSGKVIYFGDPRYEDFLDHMDPDRRERYRARASKIRDKKNRLTYKNRNSPNFYSYHLLW